LTASISPDRRGTGERRATHGPETHHHKGHETTATIGLMAGFVVMMMFDTILD
jgi:hypothetical protein